MSAMTTKRSMQQTPVSQEDAIRRRQFDEATGGSEAILNDVDPALWPARHGEVLRRYALARVNSPHIAEELVQDTFAAALQNQSRFMGRSAEQTWLVGILRHKILDYYRKNGREQRNFDRSVALEDFDIPQTSIANIRERLQREEGHRAFWGALDKGLKVLPKRTADAFRMVEIEELDTDTACARLGVSKSNLWVMLHRARKQLRVLMRDEMKISGKGQIAQALCHAG